MTYQHWKRYFEDNRSHFSDINWQEEDNLKDNEKELVSSSLQQFQRGENNWREFVRVFALAAANVCQEFLPIRGKCIKQQCQE